MKTLLWGKLAGTDIFVDIIGYDLELGKFDCHDGVTRTPDDFRYFVIPCDEMKTINKYVSELNEKNAKTSSRASTQKKTETERPKHEIKPWIVEYLKMGYLSVYLWIFSSFSFLDVWQWKWNFIAK